MNVSTKQRDDYLDNAKLLLIVLVIFAHLLEPMTAHSDMIRSIYRMIYVFHMPAFVFLVGITSKTIFSLQKTIGLILTYGVFQASYTFVFDGHATLLGRPYWIIWFLMSLMWWRIALLVFVRLPFPVLVSVIISLASGLYSSIGYPYSLSRTFVFLPFFMLGYFHGQHILSFCRTKLSLKHAGIVLVALASVAYFVDFLNSVRLLYGSYSYADLKIDSIYGVILRFAHLSVALIATVALLALVPDKKLPITYMGANVLSVYLMHGFFVESINYFMSEGAANNPTLMVVFSIVYTCFLVAVLSLRPIHHCIYAMYDGRLFKRLLNKD